VPSLTQRGFKWFFRPTPIGTDFGTAYASLLVGLKAAGHPVKTVALVNENTEYGTSTGEAIGKSVEAQGLKIAPHIAYSANSTYERRGPATEAGQPGRGDLRQLHVDPEVQRIYLGL
jgi:ABC-type branched-subunit amino acid transport system substrate-binding protein